jgi:hypothetical protein
LSDKKIPTNKDEPVISEVVSPKAKEEAEKVGDEKTDAKKTNGDEEDKKLDEVGEKIAKIIGEGTEQKEQNWETLALDLQNQILEASKIPTKIPDQVEGGEIPQEKAPEKQRISEGKSRKAKKSEEHDIHEKKVPLASEEQVEEQR